MAKVIEYKILDDTRPVQKSVADTPREFKAKVQVQPDGKKLLMVETQAETIVRPDGSQDVIIHAPTVALMNKAADEIK